MTTDGVLFPRRDARTESSRHNSIPIALACPAVQFNQLYPKCRNSLSETLRYAFGTPDTILCIHAPIHPAPTPPPRLRLPWPGMRYEGMADKNGQT